MSIVQTECERIRFLRRVANYTNQTGVARRLDEVIRWAEGLELKASFFGKPGNGAARLAKAFEGTASAFPVSAAVLEAASYRDLAPEVLADAGGRAAAVFAVPAAAPFFDETLEFVASELPAGPRKIIIVLTSDEGGDDFALIHAIGGELCAAGVRDVTVCGEEQCLTVLTDICTRETGRLLQGELGRLAPAACRELQPSTEAFAALLSISHPQYTRRAEYIRRDMEALAAISQRLHEFLHQQIERAFAQVESAARSVAAAMRQQSDTVIQQAVIPRESVANPEVRNRFGHATTESARAAGHREFEQRVHSLAMRLNSTRSILLTSMEQFRAEATPHLEELTWNIGPGLFRSWMAASGHDWADRPLDVALDPGLEFPGRILEAARRIRQGMPNQQFTGGWGVRIDSMLRNEISGAAAAGWSPSTIDQPLSAAVREIWVDTTQRPCGLLAGRLDTLLRVVTAGLTASRIGSLDYPRDETLRRQLAEDFRGYTAELERMSKS